jgi:hypothetical protein
MEPIEFFATLKERGAAKFDRDGAAEIKLECAADQLPNVLRLTALAGDKLLRVRVEVEVE